MAKQNKIQTTKEAEEPGQPPVPVTPPVLEPPVKEQQEVRRTADSDPRKRMVFFTLENSEHIDAERTKLNLYWKC